MAPLLNMFTLRSPAFEYGDEIPAEYTKEGGGFSPPLNWSGAPTGTQEYALIFEDADVGPLQERFVYWLLCRIPLSALELPQGRRPSDPVPVLPVAMHGLNSAGNLGYQGPLPPSDGEWHHYRFRLFALEQIASDLRPGMTSNELFSALRGKILESTDLMGRYRRPVSASAA